VRPGGSLELTCLGLSGGEADEREDSSSSAEPTEVSNDWSDKRGLLSSSGVQPGRELREQGAARLLAKGCGAGRSATACFNPRLASWR